jgi:hypothetical protein
MSCVVGGHYILAAGTTHFLPVTSQGRAAIAGFGVISLVVTLLIDL